MEAQFFRCAGGVEFSTEHAWMEKTASQSPQSARMLARLRLERRYDLVQGLGPVKLQLVFGVAGKVCLETRCGG